MGETDGVAEAIDLPFTLVYARLPFGIVFFPFTMFVLIFVECVGVGLGAGES